MWFCCCIDIIILFFVAGQLHYCRGAPTMETSPSVRPSARSRAFPKARFWRPHRYMVWLANMETYLYPEIWGWQNIEILFLCARSRLYRSRFADLTDSNNIVDLPSRLDVLSLNLSGLWMAMVRTGWVPVRNRSKPLSEVGERNVPASRIPRKSSVPATSLDEVISWVFPMQHLGNIFYSRKFILWL